MELLKKLESDKNRALKAKDRFRVSVLRLVLAAVKNLEIEKRPDKLTEADVKDTLAKEIKDHEDGIAIYKEVGEDERVKALEAEMAVLREYLPAVSEDEVASIIEDGIKKTGAASSTDIGRVMGFVMPKVKGQASADLVKNLILEKLNGS